MPFIRVAPAFSPFTPAQSDPLAEFIAAALGAEAPKSQKPAACRNANGCARRVVRPAKRIITPNFDIAEYEHEYILEGELPGVSDKSSISIDFADAQTIAIKGEVKRTSRSQPQEQQLTEAALQASAKDAEVESQAETVVYEAQKPKAVTIEDEVDESETSSNASFEVVDGPTKADKGKAPAKEDVEMTEATSKATAPTVQETTPATPSVRYWVAERPIGVFERKFHFNGLIDQDNVRAQLENGLLTIVIPKRQAYVRQVQIN